MRHEEQEDFGRIRAACDFELVHCIKTEHMLCQDNAKSTISSNNGLLVAEA